MEAEWGCAGALNAGFIVGGSLRAGPITPLLCSADTGNTVLSQAKDELQGQAALFKDSKKKLGTLKRQASGDRCAEGRR